MAIFVLQENAVLNMAGVELLQNTAILLTASPHLGFVERSHQVQHLPTVYVVPPTDMSALVQNVVASMETVELELRIARSLQAVKLLTGLRAHKPGNEWDGF